MTSFLLEGAPFSRQSAENKLVLRYAAERGLTVEYASTKQVLSGRAHVTAHQVPVGGLPFVRAVAQQLELTHLERGCYPSSLHPFLHRKVAKEALRTVLARLAAGAPAVFVKPAEKTKRFTGFVLDNPYDYRIAGVSKSLAIWVANPVQWLSEWRAYVVGGEIRHLSFYAGTRDVRPDLELVAEMAHRYGAADAPSGYALDVGVILESDNAQTALVEVNEGFAIGAYEDVPADVYAEMLVAYWDGLAKFDAGLTL